MKPASSLLRPDGVNTGPPVAMHIRFARHAATTAATTDCEVRGGLPVFSKSGWCKYGDHCRHEHLGMGGPSAPGVPDHIGAGGDGSRFHAKGGWHPNGDTYQYPPGAMGSMGYGGCGPGFGPGYGSFGPPSEANFTQGVICCGGRSCCCGAYQVTWNDKS